MSLNFDEYLRASVAVLEAMRGAVEPARVEGVATAIAAALAQDKPLLVCGNGGSAADAMHITAELVGRFLKERRALKAICLSANTATITAWSNDYDFASIFARQVEAYGEPGGILLAISTSGNSENVLRAAEAARANAMRVIALTGAGGGRLGPLADILLAVPSRETPLVQQAHACLYHYICGAVETAIIAKGSAPT